MSKAKVVKLDTKSKEEVAIEDIFIDDSPEYDRPSFEEMKSILDYYSDKFGHLEGYAPFMYALSKNQRLLHQGLNVSQRLFWNSLTAHDKKYNDGVLAYANENAKLYAAYAGERRHYFTLYSEALKAKKKTVDIPVRSGKPIAVGVDQNAFEAFLIAQDTLFEKKAKDDNPKLYEVVQMIEAQSKANQFESQKKIKLYEVEAKELPKQFTQENIEDLFFMIR